MSSQPRIRYPSGSDTNAQQSETSYKLPKTVKVKVTPSMSKIKLRHDGDGDTKNRPMTAVIPVTPSRIQQVSDMELLDKIQLMISQLQHNVFQQKCVSDKNLALSPPRDLDAVLQNDLWKDCSNLTVYIAVSFARHLQRVKDPRPKVHFQVRRSFHSSFDERDLGGALTSTEIDLDNVGACLEQLDRMIQKYYSEFSTPIRGYTIEGQAPGFALRKSGWGSSNSLPRAKPGSIRFDDRGRPLKRTCSLKDLEAQLTKILDVLVLDKNSFPDQPAPEFPLEKVAIEPRTPVRQVSRRTSNTSLTLTPDYTNRMRSISISSDLSISSTSEHEPEPESDYAPNTPVASSTSVSATSLVSRRSGYSMASGSGRGTSTTINMEMIPSSRPRTSVDQPQRRHESSFNKNTRKNVSTTSGFESQSEILSPDKKTIPATPRTARFGRRRGEYSV